MKYSARTYRIEWKLHALPPPVLSCALVYTEYAGVFSFLFRLSTLKLFGFSLLGMYNGKVSTTFTPAENSTFALNGWFMHTQSHIIIMFLLP